MLSTLTSGYEQAGRPRRPRGNAPGARPLASRPGVLPLSPHKAGPSVPTAPLLLRKHIREGDLLFGGGPPGWGQGGLLLGG